MDNTLTPSVPRSSDVPLARWWRRLTSRREAPVPHEEVGPVPDRDAGPAPPPKTSEAVRDVDHASRDARGRDETTTILECLRLAVMITDTRGTTTFVNDAASTLLGLSARAAAAGLAWDRVLGVTGQERDTVDARLRSPGTGSVLPVRLETAGGRHARARIDIQPHPRDRNRRLWLLYDAWETFEPEPHASAAADGAFGGLIGQSLVMKLLVKQIRDVASVEIPVLVEGETGTGKELVARAIHAASVRRDRPFVAVNCAGLTESLLGSQLFGHRRGAFTGAIADQTGLFEAANGGTLFLDEIGDMPLSMQTSLLRALQEREIMRLGESRPRAIDVRVIAATHHSLEREVAMGQFRRDLFYRIRVAHLVLPPLRRRHNDIPRLASAFLRQFESRSGKPVEISRQAIDALCAHEWPGNVRELRSVIESAALLAPDGLIRPVDLAVEVHRAEAPADARAIGEADAIIQALKRADGNRARAARMLGMSRSTFYRRLAAMGTPIDEMAIK